MNFRALVFLIVVLLIPVMALTLSKLKVTPRALWIIICAFIGFLALYGFIVVAAQFEDNRLSTELNTYDLDGDGGFDSREFTPDAQAAMERVTNDTGRTLAPITGFIFSMFYTTMIFSVGYLIEYFRRFRRSDAGI